MKVGKGFKIWGFATVISILVLMPSVHALEFNCNSCSDCNEKILNANPGNIVKLTVDIRDHDGTCIDFKGADDITFDGGGHVIAGKDKDYGIRLSSNANNNIIKDCNVRDFRHGIYIVSSSNNTLQNIIANSNEDCGIAIFYASANAIQDSLLQENRDYDFYFRTNTLTNCDNSLINVTGSGNRPIGFYNQTVNLQDIEFSALYLCNADNSVLNNITIRGSDTWANNGLRMFYTDNSILTGITSSRNFEGIYLDNADSNKMLNIKGNDNYNNGIKLRYSDGNTLENTETYSNSQYGINLYSSSSSDLTDILSMSNSGGGVYIGYGSSITINNSYIINNDGYGINSYRAGSSGANLIYNNHFCNDNNINFAGTAVYANDWNTFRVSETNIIGGSYIGGNYWAKPDGTGFSETCTDIEEDGICDGCYNLETDNIDYFPLAKGPSHTIYVNETGWWIDQFNPSSTPIRSAIISAIANDMIIVQDGNYTENACVPKRLTVRSQNGSTNCIVTAASARDHVFDVTADYVNISGFTVTTDASDIRWMAGVYLKEVDHCNIYNNILSKNYNGIQLQVSDNNILTGNTISSNLNCGIQLSSSSNNLIYNNYLDNTRNTLFPEPVNENYWNITNTTGPNIAGGPYIGGNCWHDYTGKDANGDGFVDTPYNVSGELNIDYLPLFDPPDIRIDPTTLNFKISHAPVKKVSEMMMLRPPPRSLPAEPVDRILVDGMPPKIHRKSAVSLPERNIAAGINILPNVPAFDWSYGCSPTAAAMMMGYYDNNGYPNMYTGPANGGVCPLNNFVWGYGECPLSATHQGFDGRSEDGHVDDYWILAGSGGPDPYVSNGWAQQTWGNCTADFMGTNQDKFGLRDGGTWFWYNRNGAPLYDYYAGTGQDGCYGLRRFVESRGYIVLENFNQYIYGYQGKTKGFTFENYRAEIDAGRPVIIQVTGHSMLGFGYNNNAGQQIIYIHDTWDHSDHTMQWGGSYDGNTHYGVTVMRLAQAGYPQQAGVFSIIEDDGKTLNIDSISKNESWITLAYPDTSFEMAGYGQRAVIVRVNNTQGSDSDVISVSSNDPDESPYPGGVTAKVRMCGDVNGDGPVNWFDFVTLRAYVLDAPGWELNCS